ncbi:TetR/AcrR family transcriptional regulator [Glycomyces terrestris]|uniref:TetR/AcrR family transcriptional regulator n=2 Tax=Glycomyces terrestris TaxID=2493553 RepID=A0A426V5L6_9ACTN|nr:TetR/AcrR family transcriptional regulator [Glycomyces terrestris]
MPTASKERWLDEGLTLLAESGVKAVTIDALSERLGLSKGSFYHHFKGMAGYHAALLDHFEQRETQAFIDLVESLPVHDGAVKLRALIDASVADEVSVAVEPRMRIWASHDEAARSCIARVDAKRLDYLRRQCRAIADTDRADETARLIYLVGVGSMHLVPPIPVPDQVRMCDMLISDLEAAAGRAARRAEGGAS